MSESLKSGGGNRNKRRREKKREKGSLNQRTPPFVVAFSGGSLAAKTCKGLRELRQERNLRIGRGKVCRVKGGV